ncbi:unnamed protein product [Ilex paraguariensis]|uniref:DUF641 domain-containing protein n=1 Tax=Ilex paraguariensis TaxID=185542 RepID=A0ABC8UZN8_9AQUA
MVVMDGPSKQPQISEMFQKFALAFKTKTFEFFADDEAETAATTPAAEDNYFSLLDSAEGFITDQKVIIIKPDQTHQPSAPNSNTHFTETLISSLFANISCFEASYLQFQTAHVPIDEKALAVADRSLVSTLEKLTELRRLYGNSRKNPKFDFDIPTGSCLEAQVQENQSKLRALETMVNQLQSDMDVKDDDILLLRKKFQEIENSNSKLSKRLGKNLKQHLGTEVLCTIRVFDSMLREACKTLHCFSKLLVGLMKKAGWDLDLAANSVYPDVDYVKTGHNRYALLSYVCLGMFRAFDLDDFGSSENEIVCNGHVSISGKNDDSLEQLVEHVSGNPMEFLSKNPKCDFSRFCERKYEQLIHPAMESSIFSNMDRKDVVLDSWKSLSVFYESFVKMSSSMWLLHKLARSFNPVVEIFQVERGVEFSMVYMEDVTRKGVSPGNSRPKVGFTVVPGFKIGKTVIQSKVYLTGLKCAE